MRIALLVGVLGWACWAQAKTVAFSVPPDFRVPLVEALKARGLEPLDLGGLDDALFGPDGVEARFKAGKPPTLDGAFPAEVKADLEAGLAGCASRGKLAGPARRLCAEHLVSATWERHLRRLAVERVIEIRPVEEMPLLEWASYRPGDDFILGSLLESPEPSVAVTTLLGPALDGTGSVSGVRPSLTELPGKAPLPPPLLSQGEVQALEPLDVDRHCVYPAQLKVTPPNGPLATTLTRLWAATVARQTNPYAKPPECRLSLTPLRLVVQCGAYNQLLELPVGVRFASPVLQAMVARRAVHGLLEQSCFKD
ncbi:MAG: hypothetical protein ACOZQL_39075 [Myxococcota bacterium]